MISMTGCIRCDEVMDETYCTSESMLSCLGNWQKLSANLVSLCYFAACSRQVHGFALGVLQCHPAGNFADPITRLLHSTPIEPFGFSMIHHVLEINLNLHPS